MLLKSVQKTVSILEILCKEGEKGVSELARRLALGRSNVHRLLATLVDLGYVEKNPETNRYLPTVRIFELGAAIMNRTKLHALVHHFLVKLSADFHETANLAILDKGEVVYIDKVESPESLRMDIQIGSRVPAFCTALGKALLAHLNESELRGWLQVHRFSRCTKRTVTSAASLKNILSQVREQGYAIDDEELLEGVRCIASPIRDHTGRVIAAISISGPSVRMSHDQLAQMRGPLRAATEEISKKLGYSNRER